MDTIITTSNNTFQKNESDFEHLKEWRDNQDLDFYLSEQHWNFHINQLLYRNLLTFHEGQELGAFLYAGEDRFVQPIKDYTHLYGRLFNEAYRICSIILKSPVPETKVAQFAHQAATSKFRNLRDEDGNLIKPIPNVLDLIESYHILGMINAFLVFANDHKDSIDRFLLTLSAYNDKGLPFCGYIQMFASYNEIYQIFIFTTITEGSYLRPGYDNKGKGEYLRKVLPWYDNLAVKYERALRAREAQSDRHARAEEKSLLSKISANNIDYYYEGWYNGKKGAISQENGIYRFIEMTRGKSGMLQRVINKTEDNPIVAVGIVAYWLMYKQDKEFIIQRLTEYTSIPESPKEMFERYTQESFNQFKKANRDNPDAWDWDWDFEFYTKYVIPHEMDLNKMSEVLFDYISDGDIKYIRSVMNNYMKYLEKVRQEHMIKKGTVMQPESLKPANDYKQERITEKDWDNSMDFIFDRKVRPQALFEALAEIRYSDKITDRRFYYVTYRVFHAINYFSKGTSEHQYLQWINLHFNDSEHRWIDDDEHKYLFRFKLDGSAKNLKTHPSKWNSIAMYSDLASLHYNLAKDLKNTFTYVVDGDNELKDSDSYEHLKDYAQFLSGATWVIDNYYAPENAYINKS